MSIQEKLLTSTDKQLANPLRHFLCAEIMELETKNELEINEIDCLKEMLDEVVVINSAVLSGEMVSSEADLSIKKIVADRLSQPFNAARDAGLTNTPINFKTHDNGNLFAEKHKQKEFALSLWMMLRYSANLPRSDEEKKQWDAVRV
ncbi:hypothetical protein [Brucella pseudogrignonensis]|uniref:Uncharacterized protein n=1 Tax=Brucella pseudogrignonensis TaxID=419475 RepID=A0ABU1MFR3_9HYPH|nr:hypothetical protein [Brucella pseudogrignonensis]MDR6434615.1 hypothetical protein [Brucella pseudogrignonensis]